MTSQQKSAEWRDGYLPGGACQKHWAVLSQETQEDGRIDFEIEIRGIDDSAAQESFLKFNLRGRRAELLRTEGS